MRLIVYAGVVAGALVAAVSASAHPHVLVDAKSEVVFDKGKLTAIRHIWQFDAAFTSYAVQGLDKNNDGKLSDAELAPLAKVNVESLGAFGFFTRVNTDGTDATVTPPTEYWLEFHNGRLTLFYSLPLKTPVALKSKATVIVYDPEYFVAFTFVNDGPVTLSGAPAGCAATYRPPQPLDARTLSLLSTIPVDQRAIPPGLRTATETIANLITVSCQ